MKVGVAAFAGTVILPLLCYMSFNYGSRWLLKRKKEKSDNDEDADNNYGGGGDQLDGDPNTMTTVDEFDTEYKTRLAMKNSMGSRYYNDNSGDGDGAGNSSGEDDDDDAFSIGAMQAASYSGGHQIKAAPAWQYDRRSMQ